MHLNLCLEQGRGASPCCISVVRKDKNLILKLPLLQTARLGARSRMVSAIVMLKARLLAKVQMARKPKEPRLNQVKSINASKRFARLA